MPEEIVVRGAVLPLTEAAREKFAKSQIELIAASKAQGADLPTLHAYLELAARYDLDPFANEIWCANMGGSNGSGGKLAILVGRDGYMKVARRDIAFVACIGQAVYANDHFTAEWMGDEDGWRVEHKITSVADRGKPLGAWARLIRRGLPAIFFFAPLEQFKKGGGAWKYEDSMIVKCAQSYVLRTTYGIAGPAPADELAVGFDATSTAVEDTEPAAAALPDAIVALFERAHALDPKTWRDNELLARLPDPGDDTFVPAVDGIVAELTGWLAAHEPEDADVVEAADQSFEDVEANAAQDDEPTLQERYDSDPDWRAEVDALLSRRLDLENAQEEGLPEQHADDIAAEIASIDGELEQRGVPFGWLPVADGQASLGV
jgi:hypothetical protein